MTSRDDRLAEILAECQERKDRGEAVDYDALLAKNEDLSDELQAHLSFSQRMDGANDDPPERIGDYEIRREIGRGGMGVVYEALQVSIDRPVALKLLHTAFLRSSDAIARFRREARAAGQLRHRNIVPIRETGRERGIWYIAMELVEGEPLNRVIDGLAGRAEPAMDLPEGDSYFEFVAERFAGVADALQEAHRAGVIHRDIKPGNLILANDGPLMIVDFGLARLTAAGSVTATGSMLGTPEYMSPEQALVTGTQIDHRTDIYSLSATLYELLTLQPAVRGTSIAQICAAIASTPPIPPRSINPKIPRPLQNIVLRGLAKDPDQRYQTASELADDLHRFAAGEKTQAVRPRPRWLAPALLVLLLALASLFLVPWGSEPESTAAAGGDSYASALRLEAEGKLTDALIAIDEVFAQQSGAKPYRVRLRILMELGRYEELYRAARGYREQGIVRQASVTRYELTGLRALGEYDEAKKLAQVHLDSGNKGRGVPVSYLQAVAGHTKKLRVDRAKDAYYLACVASVLEDRAATIQALERAIEGGQRIPPNARVEPDLRIWKDDETIQALLDRMRGNVAAAKPRRVTGSRKKAIALESAGRLEEALAEIEGACASNHAPSHGARLRILMELGRYDEMLRCCRESQQQLGRSPGLVRKELVALRALDRHDDARALAKSQHAAGRGMPVARSYSAAVLGLEKEAREALASARKQPFHNAWVYSILKDRDGTIASLKQAKARGERIPPNAKTPPDLDVWSTDKEIQGLLGEMRD